MIYGLRVAVFFFKDEIILSVCYNNNIDSVNISFLNSIESRKVPHVVNCLFELMYISHKLTV